MAKRSKSVEVKKFGGVEDIGTFVETNAVDAPVKDVHYDLNTLEVKSDTTLEEDKGYGGAAIVRMFEFSMNPQTFAQHSPTKQELFNSHYKGIEVALWKDGMKILPDVDPRVVVDPIGSKYMIFVGAAPQRGHLLSEQPKTLSELVHGNGPK